MSPLVSVITGANRGLGLATARALGARGHRVVLAGRDPARAEAAAAALRSDGHDAHAGACDTADADSVAAFADDVLGRFGRVDVLVNNAGAIFGARHATLDVPRADFAASLEVNVLGAWQLGAALLPGMNARGYGRVVNVSSGMGGLTEMGSGYPAYRVSKAALNAVSRLLAHEAGPGVLVNAVCPGWVRTEMGGPSATRSVDEGIAGIVWAATLPEGGPSGGFFRDGLPIPW